MASRLTRTCRRLGRWIRDPHEAADTIPIFSRMLMRGLVGNPAWLESDHAPGAILSIDPMIVHTTIHHLDPTAWMRAFASRSPADPATFMIYMSWSLQAGSWVTTIAREFDKFRKAYPQHRIEILCNEQREVDAFAGVGEPALLINHNVSISEQFFYPVDETAVEFDAVCNARFSPQKGIHLAAMIDKVAYVTRQIEGDDPVAEQKIFADVRRLAPRHRIVNEMADQRVIPLTVDQVNATYGRAAVGLCLSAVEGQMLSSMEYMLAGLPIVSIPNRGGRDLFFDAEFCLTVEPRAERIRDAVAELRARRIPRDHIRRKTLEKLAPQREAFVALVNQCLARCGAAQLSSVSWPWPARRNFSFWGSVPDHLRLAADNPPLRGPALR